MVQIDPDPIGTRAGIVDHVIMVGPGDPYVGAVVVHDGVRTSAGPVQSVLDHYLQ